MSPPSPSTRRYGCCRDHPAGPHPPGQYPPACPPPRPQPNWWLIGGLALLVLLLLGVVAPISLYLAFHKNTVAANKVAVGDCLAKLPDSGLVLAVDTVDCEEQHTGEIFAEPELAKYSPEAASDPEVGLFVLYPSEDS
jgi:hypothetical protein